MQNKGKEKRGNASKCVCGVWRYAQIEYMIVRQMGCPSEIVVRVSETFTSTAMTMFDVIRKIINKTRLPR